MKEGQKRGDGWKVARDGSVTVQFKLNINNKDDRELLDQLQEWRQRGQMTANMKKAIPLQAAIKNGTKKIVDATWFKDVIAKIDQWLSQPLPVPVDSKPAGLKPLSGLKPIAMPNFDDDEENNTMIVNVDANAAANTANSFFDAMLNLNQ